MTISGASVSASGPSHARGSGQERVDEPGLLTSRPPLPPPIDLAELQVIAGMLKFPGVLEAVRRLGPDLFPPGAARTLAVSVIIGAAPDASALSRRERAQLAEIVSQLSRTSLPHDEEDAMRMVRVQAEARYAELLAAQLRWAADRLDRGGWLRQVRVHVVRAFDIAEGLAPIDAGQCWEDAQ